MRFVAEPISDLRLQRFHRWAMFWLTWFAAFLDAAAAFAPISTQATAIGHRWLDRVERAVVAIVMLRAAPRVRASPPRKGVCEHRRNDSALGRAVIGSAIRGSLRPKDLRLRIEALMQRIDALVARLLRRLPRGLTRRRPIRARRDAMSVYLRDSRGSFTQSRDTS